MDTQNSQKKSRRSSAKNEKSRADMDRTEQPLRPPADFDPDEYLDRSNDHIARVRAAREAARRSMESFGDVSEYDITIIPGELKEEPLVGSQGSLDFRSDTDPEGD